MIKHVAITGFPVSDQAAALDFWVNKVGFEKRRDDPYGEDTRWIEVAPPGATTRIVLSPASADDPVRVGGPPALVFEPDDIQATYGAMVARGVVFTDPPTLQPWGTQAVFLDPDGRSFVLVQP